jgi:hypothetical protein
MAIRVSCLFFTCAFGFLVCANSVAQAQTCKPGTRVSGTTTIQKMGANPNVGMGLTVTKFTNCGLTFVIIEPKLISGVANCKVGSRLTTSGVVRTRDNLPYLHATSARCP